MKLGMKLAAAFATASAATVRGDMVVNVPDKLDFPNVTETALTFQTVCAEHESVELTGPGWVRYGDPDSSIWTYQEFTVDSDEKFSLWCSNAVFGDPIYGTVKQCQWSGAMPETVPPTERPGTSGCSPRRFTGGHRAGCYGDETSVIILCVFAVFSLTFLVCSCWFALKAAKENTSTVETVAVAHPIVGDRGADETITVAQPRLTREEREDMFAKRALMFNSMEDSVTLDPFALFRKAPKAPKEPKQ
jgi:hypothetical protein